MQNRNGVEFNIDDIITDLNGKMDRDGSNASTSACTETYISGNSWYRVYSDGWCEQGSLRTDLSDIQTTFTFLKPYTKVCYVRIQRRPHSNAYVTAVGIDCNFGAVWSVNNTSFGAWGNWSSANYATDVYWQAGGYIN